MSKITKDQIKHIADLAKLDLTEEELAKFDREFNDILGYVSQIEECDTEGIEFEHNLEDYKGTVLQEDVVREESIPKKKMLQNATNGRGKNGYIRTSRMVGGE